MLVSGSEEIARGTPYTLIDFHIGMKEGDFGRDLSLLEERNQPSRMAGVSSNFSLFCCYLV